MPFDPNEGLRPEDASFLSHLHDLFKKNRLVKVAERALQGVLTGQMLAEAEKRGIDWRGFVLGHLPVTVEAARGPFLLTPAHEKAIEAARESSARYITDMADDLKAGVRERVAQAVEKREPATDLARGLFGLYAEANRDWRRIAITEAAGAVSNGYLASQPEGTAVVGDSAVDACAWCQGHINNRLFYSLPEAPEEVTLELSARYLWPDKNNVGRSKYARRADGSSREPEELWHACIPAHPHCRCRVRRFIPQIEQVDPETFLVTPKPLL